MLRHITKILIFLLFVTVQNEGEQIYQFVLSFNTVPDSTNTNRGSASTQTKITQFSPNFSYTSFSPDESVSAVWLSTVIFENDGTFSESGNISIGNTNNMIFFKSVVFGVSRSNDEFSYGTISYEITGGTGIYEKVNGCLVDMFYEEKNAPNFFINAWGWLYIPGTVKQPKHHSLPLSSPQHHQVQQQPKSSKTRYEFALVFENTPVSGVNYATAHPQHLQTVIQASGELKFSSLINSSSEISTLWISIPTSYPNGTFSNKGSIILIHNTNNSTIGSINFSSSTLGQARDGPSSGDSYGGITYWIDSGTGLWEGASGMMTDIFVEEDKESTYPILVWAIFWV